MDVYKNLQQLGLVLPPPPPAGGIYSAVVPFGQGLIYTSGIGPLVDGRCPHPGKLGGAVTLEQGRHCAQLCILNLLAVLHRDLGDLNHIQRFVKMLGFVASESDFASQPQVLNGASQLLLDLFGQEAGLPARSAIGTNVLPGDIPVEIEMLLERKA